MICAKTYENSHSCTHNKKILFQPNCFHPHTILYYVYARGINMTFTKLIQNDTTCETEHI